MSCHTLISNCALGTQHRNHCPSCLWSRHLDLNVPGDRKSTCGARMKPIGLTLKGQSLNPYTGRISGEIMLVHLCLTCGRISANRIAGDDNAYAIIKLLRDSTQPDPMIMDKLDNLNIHLLSREDEQMAATALFGINYREFIE